MKSVKPKSVNQKRNIEILTPEKQILEMQSLFSNMVNEIVNIKSAISNLKIENREIKSQISNLGNQISNSKSQKPNLENEIPKTKTVNCRMCSNPYHDDSRKLMLCNICLELMQK
jgi:predicted  nucleic acid-binding Zn-ribbon protein